jgi:hypothetical protein
VERERSVLLLEKTASHPSISLDGLISCTAVISDEGPKFKNEDVKEKLEGRSHPYTGPLLNAWP